VTCHTRALLRWWFTKRRCIKCTYLYLNRLTRCDVDADGENKISTRSSTLNEPDGVRHTSSLALHEMRQQDFNDPGVTLDTGSTVLPPHHAQGQQSLQTVDCRSWPRLDVTMATRVQPSSTVQLGKHHAHVIITEDMRGKWTGSRYFLSIHTIKFFGEWLFRRRIFFSVTHALCTDNRTRISKRKKNNKNNILSTTEIRYSKNMRYRTQFKK